MQKVHFIDLHCSRLTFVFHVRVDANTEMLAVTFLRLCALQPGQIIIDFKAVSVGWDGCEVTEYIKFIAND